MFSEDQLRSMSEDERLSLLRTLMAMNSQVSAPDPRVERRRAIFLLCVLICCIALAAWIGVLAVTLPRYYRAGGWRGAWVGFDLAELAAFAVTGWAVWRRRQILIICLVVLATLLCCDAWFDVVLDARTSGFLVSLLSAVLIELPLAAVAIFGARRLLRSAIAASWLYRGAPGAVPSLRRAELVTNVPGNHLRDIFGSPDAVRVDAADPRQGDQRPSLPGMPEDGAGPDGAGPGAESGPDHRSEVGGSPGRSGQAGR